MYSEVSPSEKTKQSKKESAEAQRVVDVARERNFDVKKLLLYDLVTCNPLYDKECLMKKPLKSSLCPELEKDLTKDDYGDQSKWTLEMDTCYIVDITGNAHRITTRQRKTFGQYINAYINQIDKLCVDATSIQFVFNSYLDGSERFREDKEK